MIIKKGAGSQIFVETDGKRLALRISDVRISIQLLYGTAPRRTTYIDGPCINVNRASVALVINFLHGTMRALRDNRNGYINKKIYTETLAINCITGRLKSRCESKS